MHRGSNNRSPRIIDKGFLDSLLEFIRSVEYELDILLPHSSSLQFLSYYKVIDYLITQRRRKNITIRLLCALDDNTTKIIRKMVPFIGYKSIKPASNKTGVVSLVFIRDKQDIFSISINMQHYDIMNKDYIEIGNKDDSIFSIDDWVYSKNNSLVKSTVSSFEIIWDEKDNYDKIIKEKKHSELLVDLTTHDIGNYHQIVQSSLGLVNSLLKKNKTMYRHKTTKKFLLFLIQQMLHLLGVSYLSTTYVD